MSINRTWIDAEPLILARLRARLPDVEVLIEADAPAALSDLPVPCVLLRYVGYAVKSQQTNATEARLVATWQALVIDRHGSEIDVAGPARGRLSDICSRTLSAVLGYRVAGFPMPLQLTEAPGAFIEAGRVMHPVAFSLEFVAQRDAST